MAEGGKQPANDGKSTRMEEEQSSENSGFLKKIRGRCGMASQQPSKAVSASAAGEMGGRAERFQVPSPVTPKRERF
jgi:hypothetical protein